jgi:hypothetical protein
VAFTLACMAGLAAVYRMSFTLDGRRWAMATDDAMISMRYARNLAEGHGLVWNPGQYVEGFTNPLWTLAMSVMHTLHLPENFAALPVQLLGVACLAATVVLVYRLGGALPAVLTAVYLPLTYWSVSGLEVPAVAMCAVLAAYCVREGNVRRAYAVATVAFLLRPDAGLMAVAIAAATPRWRWQGISLLSAVAVAVTAARMGYYGDVLPNTFYLKAGDLSLPRIARGVQGLAQSQLVLLGLAAVGYVAGRRHALARYSAACLAAFAGYSAFVGGDAWDWWAGGNRFIVAVSPLALLLSARIAERYRPSARITFALVLVLALHSRMHRELLGMRPLLHARDHRAQTELALALREAYPDARLAVTWAGIVPYLHGGRCIDILGKCDRRIARTRPHAGETVPGHTKWDYSYSVLAQRPDIIVALWKDTAAVCRAIAGTYAYTPAGVRIRKDYAATVAARK